MSRLRSLEKISTDLDNVSAPLNAAKPVASTEVLRALALLTERVQALTHDLAALRHEVKRLQFRVIPTDDGLVDRDASNQHRAGGGGVRS